MKIRILTPIASADWSFAPGQVVDRADLPAGAMAWVSVPLEDGSFRAVVVDADAVIEEATATAPEVAARRVKGRSR